MELENLALDNGDTTDTIKRRLGKNKNTVILFTLLDAFNAFTNAYYRGQI